MKLSNLFFIIISIALMIGSVIYYVKKPNHQPDPTLILKADIDQASRYMANLYWNNLNEYYPYYDLDVFFQSMKELANGDRIPLDSGSCYEGLAKIWEKIEAIKARKTLYHAEKFLSIISQEQGIIEKEPGKLYYQILIEGTKGNVGLESAPLLHFTEYDTNNQIIRTTRDKSPLRIPLREALAGFSLGIVGMKIGEKRKLFIHPDLAYRKLENIDMSIAIFDVEILDE